ncbi:MAG: hypothetical protein JXC85_00470 [Candidatus Aenigmarchaeota archaeon]|nr:hypothetical protein [Candidatus Aenigmarchaeota archaeon]
MERVGKGCTIKVLRDYEGFPQIQYFMHQTLDTGAEAVPQEAGFRKTRIPPRATEFSIASGCYRHDGG